jgi:hypothetical protein
MKRRLYRHRQEPEWEEQYQMQNKSSSILRVVLAASLSLMIAMATTAANAASLIHSYDFNNSLADTLGAGPDMTNNGGTLGAAGLTFGNNEGPTFAGLLPSSSIYAIEMQVTLDFITGFRKLIDFDNQVPDIGLYNVDGKLTFFGLTASSGNINADVSTNILFSRDAANQITGYVDGVQAWSVADVASLALVDDVLHFMRDDGATGFREATSGFLDYIRF